MAITFRFVNRNTNAEGIRVYKSATSFESNTLPSVLRTIPADATEFVDPDVARGETYFYMFETFLGEDSAFSPLVYAEALPTETGPGPQILIGGDNWAGFFGEIPASEFITGDKLAEHFGFTAGTAQNSDVNWLKFACDGETLFVPKQTFRYNLSWDQINASNLVFGDRVIEVQGDLYQVRLLKGAASDPISGGLGLHDPEQSWSSEWNRLFYPLVPNPTSTPTHPISQEGIQYGEWADYTEADLLDNSTGGNGSRTWCQESGGTSRVWRGGFGVSYFSLSTSSVASSVFGWRPVLQLLRHRDQFLGEVPVTDLINGDELASKIGLTTGTAQFSDEPWLKFMTREGKTLYVAKKPFRHNLSWSSINNAGAVYGDSLVYINGRKYKVRLLKGANTDPTPNSNGYDPEQSWGSEWNRLFYPLVPNPTNKPDSGISGEGIVFGSWANYTEADLVVHSTGGSGSSTWCQESAGSTRVYRGYQSATYRSLGTNTITGSSRGWRPVLELVS